MRFESKHSYFKRAIRTCQNFKNVSKFLAHRHQLLQAFCAEGSLFAEPVVAKDAVPFHINLYSDTLIRAHDHKNSRIADCVTVHSVKYASDMLLPLEAEYQMVTFGRMVASLIDENNSVHYIVRKGTAQYVTGTGMYKLLQPSQDFVCISYSALLVHAPLMEHEIQGQSYIVLKYALLHTSH